LLKESVKEIKDSNKVKKLNEGLRFDNMINSIKKNQLANNNNSTVRNTSDRKLQDLTPNNANNNNTDVNVAKDIKSILNKTQNLNANNKPKSGVRFSDVGKSAETSPRKTEKELSQVEKRSSSIIKILIGGGFLE